MKHVYETKGTCAKKIEFNIEEDTISKIRFVGGCSGNGRAMASLLEGMKVEDAINKLSGIICGPRDTSCADQFAIALREVLTKEAL